MAEISSIAVVEYLKKGSSSVPVTQDEISEYFNKFVLSNPDLALHYKIKIDECLRFSAKTGDISGLLEYLSDVLNCVVFVLEEAKDSSKGSLNLKLRGLNKLADHSDFELLLHFLENENAISSYFEENFSLYPITLTTNLSIGGKDILDIGFLSTDFGAGFRNRKIGLLGDLGMDYDLAVGVLSYLAE